jgi:fructose-1,6-bisphosphatase/inositol monophosphatase family enzyme
VSPEDVLEVLHAAAVAVRDHLEGLTDWGLAGTREGQYRSDLVADRAALDVLLGAGLGVVSEESGVHEADRPIVVVLDPVDGSTNASRHLPWWATSLCALDDDGPLAAVVVNQATGRRYEATRGGGARADGRPIHASATTEVGHAILTFSGYPSVDFGWSQFRALGAAALDLCAVAEGALDGFVDFAGRSLSPWDYLGGLLVCREAGAGVEEAWGRDMVTRDPAVHRTIVAAGTAALLEQLVAARRAHGPRPAPS